MQGFLASLGHAPPRRRPARVLVVEDDPLFRKFSVAALQEARHSTLDIRVETAGSWAEAERLLQGPAYDCLLVDLGLPDVQGLDTVRAALEGARGAPVVVLTGDEDAAIAETILREGAQDFIEKTEVDPGVLERAIRHAVDRGRWAAELAAKNRELEVRNSDLDDFAHVISHDLKAPLRAVFYLVKEAEEHLGSGEPAAAREALAGIAPRIERLFGMIDDVLRLTQAGRSRQEAARVDAGQLVAEVVASLPVPPGFRVEVAPGLPAVAAERAALTQVFQNLIDNALKHHGGERGLVQVGWRDGGPVHEFSVEDDGRGIPPHLQERVFRLFQSFGKDGKGSGVGLALVRKLVEANGGAVWIEDRAGGGVRFFFTWPKDPPPPGGATEEGRWRVAAAPGGGRQVGRPGSGGRGR